MQVRFLISLFVSLKFFVQHDSLNIYKKTQLNTFPIGSMGLVYLPTLIPYI